MAERNWRDEIEPVNIFGKPIRHAEWCPCKNVWMCIVEDGKELIYSSCTAKEKPKPATYRPYKRGEVKCGDVFKHKKGQQQSLVTCVYSDGSFALGDRDACNGGQELFDNYTHLDGTPAGVKE